MTYYRKKTLNQHWDASQVAARRDVTTWAMAGWCTTGLLFILARIGGWA